MYSLLKCKNHLKICFFHFRFSENEQPDKFKVSPNTQRRILCDSSAQTELRSRDVDIQTKVDLKSVAATTTDLEQQKISRGRIPYEAGAAVERLRCPAEDAKGKPIIARVYVHTKRQKGRRSTRKSTAFRRDYQGEKVSRIRRIFLYCIRTIIYKRYIYIYTHCDRFLLQACRSITKFHLCIYIVRVK